MVKNKKKAIKWRENMVKNGYKRSKTVNNSKKNGQYGQNGKKKWSKLSKKKNVKNGQKH